MTQLAFVGKRLSSWGCRGFEGVPAEARLPADRVVPACGTAAESVYSDLTIVAGLAISTTRSLPNAEVGHG